MKKSNYLLWPVTCFTTILLLFIWGCQKEAKQKLSTVKAEQLLKFGSGFITPNIIHFKKDTVYVIQGPLDLQAGQQLTIDEGTLVKFNSGSGIVVNAGASLQINGTKENPVVLTSSATKGTQGLNWAGVIVIGKAKNNTRATIPGTDTSHFSCTLKYVRIEFAALTLDAAGSGSIVENVMVSYSSSPAYSFLGGSVNCSNLISYACGGAADFYITNGYNGKMKQLLASRHPFFGDISSAPANSFAGVYIANNSNGNVNAIPLTYPVISNLTVLGPNGQNGSTTQYSDTMLSNAALVATYNSHFRIRNSILAGFNAGALHIGDSLTAITFLNGQSEIRSSIFQCADTSRTFYLNPAAFRNLQSRDLKNFMLQVSLKNKVFLSIADFNFIDPFNYEMPKIFPAANASILTGADFSGTDYGGAFFKHAVNHIGASGTDNWLQGWVNFTPLKTNYNNPE
ncbi:hypothetical protein [Ferruginibacter sp.]